MKTLQTLLTETRDALQSVSDSPAYESQRILSALLKKPTAYLLTWPETPVSSDIERTLNHWINARQQGQPLAQLLGEWDFFGRAFQVTPDTLTPRADTEILIEQVLARFEKTTDCKALDLGTGSGIIAITLALELPQSEWQAIDQSEKALTVAQANAQTLNARVNFSLSDWFSAIENQAGTFDLIVSNPPYIPENDPHLAALTHEPLSALVAEQQGMADLNHIAKDALRFLKPGGWLLMEHGYDQSAACLALLKNLGYHQVEDCLDYGGHPRIIIGQKPEQTHD